MAGFSVHIEGLHELDAKLAELGGDKAKKVVDAALRAGGKVFLEAVTAAAPERAPTPSGTALPPGALAHDIGMRLGKNDEGLPAEIIAPGRATEHVARFVEYGHRIVRGGYSKATYRHGRFVGYLGPGRQLRDEGGELMEVQPYPFIRPAYEASVNGAIDAFVAALKEGIEAEAAK